jgi:hypothetical protein
MIHKFRLKAKEVIDAVIEKYSLVQEQHFKIWSIWDWEHWRKINGIYRLIDEWRENNVCTDEGLTDLLGVHFSGDTQKTSWYISIFEDNYTPLITNTYATPGFTECTAYDETTRPQWQEAGATAKAISNTASKASFTFNASKTIYGGALVGGGTDPNTKGNTAGGGVLFCSSQFTSGSKAVVSTDILKVSVSLSVADT